MNKENAEKLWKIIQETATNEFLYIKDYEIYVGGDTAVASDTKTSIDADILWLAPVSLLAILFVLIILLKSIVFLLKTISLEPPRRPWTPPRLLAVLE